MRAATIDLATIEVLTAGRFGCLDVACPLCGPGRRIIANQRRPVLRIWRPEAWFASYHCARCGERGYARDGSATQPDPLALARIKAEAAERERGAAIDRLGKARWIWSKRQPIIGSIAEKYLRRARGYDGDRLPATLGFLPARGEHGPAMVAAFGFPDEPEPGALAIAGNAVRAVHLTRLLPDGSDRERGEATSKIMIGMVRGSPIVLAPANDLGGLAVTEGIEDGLTVFEATRLGVWVAGSAGFMPALAEYLPAHIESVIIFAHDDEAGQAGARGLAQALQSRGLVEVFVESLL
jgi:hypothetical protein